MHYSHGELVRLARSGNKAAFAELIERYHPMVRRMALGVLGHADLAEEITQEAFLAAYLSLGQLREPERFPAWLYSIVLNAARACLKERQQHPLSLEHLMGGMQCDLLPFSDALVDPQEVAEEHELHRLLLAAVQALTPKERAATLLFYYQQLSLQEIAAILGISVTAVKSRLFQARQHLRAQLLPLYEELLPLPPPSERTHAMREVSITAVRINFLTKQRVVTLWDAGGRRLLLIKIAQADALPIALGLSGLETPRPLTIHFLANIMKATGVQLEEVRIESLKENIYYAVAKVRNGKQVSEVDVRPSDALGLALLLERPILVAEDLLARAGMVVPEGKTAELYFAERWLEREGITLPEGKTIQITHDKEQERAAQMMQSVEEILNPTRTPPTAEELEQAKQRYLAYLLGEETSPGG